MCVNLAENGDVQGGVVRQNESRVWPRPPRQKSVRREVTPDSAPVVETQGYAQLYQRDVRSDSR